MGREETLVVRFRFAGIFVRSPAADRQVGQGFAKIGRDHDTLPSKRRCCSLPVLDPPPTFPRSVPPELHHQLAALARGLVPPPPLRSTIGRAVRKSIAPLLDRRPPATGGRSPLPLKTPRRVEELSSQVSVPLEDLAQPLPRPAVRLVVVGEGISLRFRVSRGAAIVEEVGPLELGLRLHPAPSTGRVVVSGWLYPDRGGLLHLGHGASAIVGRRLAKEVVDLGGEASPVDAFLGSFVLRPRVFFDAHCSPILSTWLREIAPSSIWRWNGNSFGN